VLALVLSVPGVALAQKSFPEVIPLPDGWQPEGIVIGRGTTFYSGSLATGAIYAGDLRTGEGEILVPPQPGRVAVGLSYDQRSNYIYVAGGATGDGYVYDAETGETVAVFDFTSEASFVNDVVVTRDAAYFTDSFRPFIYKVPLSRKGGQPDLSNVEAIPLGGEFTFVPGQFNLNGIDATANGQWLVVVQSNLGALYRVDPATGFATLIDLGGASVPNGDGILLNGKILYVVQNRLNQIAEIRLDQRLESGEIVRHLTDPDFRVPTTIDQFDNALYAVNARFGTPPTPETEYEVVRVPIK
jgi:sugar lactone lactonase YvrE